MKLIVPPADNPLEFHPARVYTSQTLCQVGARLCDEMRVLCQESRIKIERTMTLVEMAKLRCSKTYQLTEGD